MGMASQRYRNLTNLTYFRSGASHSSGRFVHCRVYRETEYIILGCNKSPLLLLRCAPSCVHGVSPTHVPARFTMEAEIECNSCPALLESQTDVWAGLEAVGLVHEHNFGNGNKGHHTSIRIW